MSLILLPYHGEHKKSEANKLHSARYGPTSRSLGTYEIGGAYKGKWYHAKFPDTLDMASKMIWLETAFPMVSALHRHQQYDWKYRMRCGVVSRSSCYGIMLMRLGHQ